MLLRAEAHRNNESSIRVASASSPRQKSICSQMSAPEFLGQGTDALLIAIQYTFVLCCWVYLISGLDDLAVDLLFLKYQLRDWLLGRATPMPTVETLLAAPEQPFAIMFPAWHEADVIGAAVANILGTLDYANFEVFVGTYPNDPDTQREVDKLSARFRNVHKVVTGAPGPTCKADCLNHVIAAIREHEARSGITFVGVVMQDAEDVVHPLALRLFNHFVPDFDLVQTPVLSLMRRWWDLTGGHYMEEFAEFHAKEMLVRERFAGVVPGSGVGTCYSRRALELAEATGETFSTRSLTEDYEFSFRMRDAGLNMIFARMAVTRRVPSQWLAVVAVARPSVARVDRDARVLSQPVSRRLPAEIPLDDRHRVARLAQFRMEGRLARALPILARPAWLVSFACDAARSPGSRRLHWLAAFHRAGAPGWTSSAAAAGG